MLEFALNARQGRFHLDAAGSFDSEWTVIFGPSGSGKSTLLRLLAGLRLASDARPVMARVALDGRLLADTGQGLWLKPGKRMTGMVAQQPALFPHLTVADNVGYGLDGLDKARRSARVEEMLTLAGATELLGRRAQDLSGGEAQRVALARALATRPRLLLLDEPFSALDSAASDALLLRLKDWTRDEKIQAVMATHDASDALAIGAEVALLAEGRFVTQGPAAEVLAAERKRLLERMGAIEVA